MKNKMTKDVTAIMVTQNRERYRYTMMALRSFFHQTYQNKRLLIINNGIPVYAELAPPPNVKEIVLEHDLNMTVGDLRNIGLNHCETELVIPWDDDDWRRNDFIETMATAYKDGKPVLLRGYVNYDVHSGEFVGVRFPDGSHGVILHPLNEYRYQSMKRRSDTKFRNNWQDRTIIENDLGLYVRLYTGFNLWDRQHIMKYNTFQIETPKELDLMLEDLQSDTFPETISPNT